MSVCCNKLKINPLFDGIKEGDFDTPIEKLAKHYNNVDQYAKLLKDKKSADRMMYYIMCRPKISCVITRKKHKKLEETAVHHHVVKMNSNGIMYLMFQLLTVRHFFKEATERVNALFKTTKELHAYFIEYPTLKNLDIDNSEICYRTWNFLEAITAAKLIIPENNKWYFENSKFERLTEKHFYKGFKTFNSGAVWFYKNFSLLELERVCFFGGIFLFYMGVRPIGDLDVMISKEGSQPSTDQKIKDRFYEKKGDEWVQRYIPNDTLNVEPFLEDVYWRPYFKHLYYSGAKYFYKLKKSNQIMFEPSSFVYFYGFKCLNFELSVLSRYLRNRPRSTAELLIANEIFGLNNKVPPLPTFYLKMPNLQPGLPKDSITKYTNYEADFAHQDKIVSTQKFKEIMEPVDEKKWLGTIQWYIKRDYRINMTTAEIKEKIEKTPKFDLHKMGIVSKECCDKPKGPKKPKTKK